MAERFHLAFHSFHEPGTDRPTDEESSSFLIAKLRGRQKQKHAVGVSNIEDPCVLRNANNLEISIVRPDSKANMLADRIHRLEETFGQQAVDNGCARMVFIVRPIEVAALDERNTKRSKESRRND